VAAEVVLAIVKPVAPGVLLRDFSVLLLDHNTQSLSAAAGVELATMLVQVGVEQVVSDL
jgi:hypothetical protein